jgi:5-methylcytosine-specific restriction endonuclease McrA
VAAKNKHHKLKQELWSSTGADTTRIDAEMKALAREFGVLSFRRNWWDMDHTIPVIEGGGECGLENLRTLCILCHKKVTKELAARRAANRKTEKEQK